MTSVQLSRPVPLRWLALLSAMALAATSAGATGLGGTPAARDAYRLLRYEEDYSHLCRGTRNGVLPQEDFWDPLKCLCLGSDRYLSLGGELRLQYEHYDRLGWGAARDDRDGYLLQRYMVHGGLRAGKHLRAFIQVKSGLEDGRQGGPRPADEDKLDLHQAFLDIAVGEDRARFTFRAGRQEIALGNSRLVTVRDGANVRLAFDGVRASMVLDNVDATVFALTPVRTRVGVFDDSAASRRRLIGAYVAVPRSPAARRVDVYYFDHKRPSASFAQAADREHRSTFGVRVSGKAAALRYDVDAILQRGSFGHAKISAWAFAVEAEPALPTSWLDPRFVVRVDVGSGDARRTDPRLGTFHPLYPRGPRGAQPPLIGASNVIALRPALQVSPRRRLTVTAEFAALWRESAGDGLYGQDGDLFLSAGATPARRIGQQLSLEGRWTMDRHSAIVISGSRFWAGPFLAAVTPGRNLGFVTLLLEYRF